MSTMIESVHPFLKWAGGKRWLVSGDQVEFPDYSGRYIEPFLGGGAVFFHIQPDRGILADANERLIEVYQAIRDDWEKVLFYLKKHQRDHCNAYYYKVRESKYRSVSTRAAQFLYLNRTCWNGLYRVNLSGKFNVPIGTKNAVIMGDNFEGISRCLRGMEIISSDFEIVVDKSQKGDFLFVDPPYTVKHNLNGFVKYNEKIFSWDDQVRLKNSLVRAKKRGVKILLTNANHASILELYSSGFSAKEVYRKSVISGSCASRGMTSELIII